MKNDEIKSKGSMLRKKAEALLRKKQTGIGSHYTKADTLKLLNELEVHQVELEIQNEELRLAVSAANDATEKYTELYDFAPVGYLTLSKKGEIVGINLCGAQMLGKVRSHLMQSTFTFFVSDDTKPIFNLFLEKAFTSKTKKSCEIILSTGDSLPVHVYLCGIVKEKSERCFVTMVDISEKKKRERLILELNKQLESIFDASPIMIFHKDKENRFIRVNKALAKANRMTKEEMEGKTLWEIYPRKVADHYWRDDKEVMAACAPKFNIIEKMPNVLGSMYVSTDKVPYTDSEGNIIGVLGFSQDITALVLKEKKLKEQNMELEHTSTFDSLTKIANRYFFEKSANLIYQASKRYNRKFAILEIDIDNFKWINDQYGHDIGDILLRTAASIITQSTRESDLLARIGGDEFGLILAETKNTGDAGLVADKIIKLFAKPIDINGKLICCSVSIGIACYPSEGVDSFDKLFKQADIAMYNAKEKGRNCFDFFSDKTRIEYYEKMKLESILRDALKTNQFYLHYLPVVDMRVNKIVGVEALLQLTKSSNLGVITPSVFIPVLEKLNLIQDVGLWVFDRVCSDIKTWTEKGVKGIFYSVNVSAKELSMESFCEDFKSVASKYAVDLN